MNAPIEDPPHLRTLRRLVNIMTVVFTLGFITIVIVIVMQFTRGSSAPAMGASPELPSGISLPDSETAQAITFGTGWIAIVTIDPEGGERIRVYSPDGTPRQTMEIGNIE